MDWVLCITTGGLVLFVGLLIFVGVVRYDKQTMRQQTEEFNQRHFADKQPRQF